jgi:retron-type reverse transcriptase
MNKTEFTNRIGIQLSALERISERSKRCYVSFYKTKKDGSNRVIDSPNIELKGIQSFILRDLLEKKPVHNVVHGFRKKRGIKSNAKNHLKRQYYLGIDIKSFFPSITIDQVNKVFLEIVGDESLADMLSKLCTLNHRLPQGGVTSPYLSNLVFYQADEAINTICREKRISYTRYADDLTFSAKEKTRLIEVLPSIKNEINANGFNLNSRKTRFMSGAKRIEVTGVVLNSKKLSIGRNRKKNLRAALFKLATGTLPQENINKTIGMLSFLKDIEPDRHSKFVRVFKKNLKRFRQGEGFW